MIVTFIPAAGASSRMGECDKLLETINGEPILTRTARIACQANLGPVLVGLRRKDATRRNTVSDLNIEIVNVAGAAEGMAATLRAGAKAASAKINEARKTASNREYSGMMILLPDMPEVTESDLINMGHAHQSSRGAVVRATTQDGKLGHPTLFPDDMLAAFEGLKGDKGAASLIDDSFFQYPLPNNRALLDLDTPEDWATWRAITNTPH